MTPNQKTHGGARRGAGRPRSTTSLASAKRHGASNEELVALAEKLVKHEDDRVRLKAFEWIMNTGYGRHRPDRTHRAPIA